MNQQNEDNVFLENEEEFTEYHIHQMGQLSQKFAKAKADRTYLENYRKVVRAQIAEEKAKEGVKANSQQVQSAEADPRYLQVLEGLRAAIYVETRAYWDLKQIEIRFDYWRTNRADQRAAMNLK